MNYKVRNQEQLTVAQGYIRDREAGKEPNMAFLLDRFMEAVLDDGEYREYNTALSGEKRGGK